MKSYICFPGGKFKVLTMSYDDGKLEDRQLISIFNKHGIKGTFHINSGMFAQEIRIKPDEFSTLYKGHEIACHTLTHRLSQDVRLVRLSEKSEMTELTLRR